MNNKNVKDITFFSEMFLSQTKDKIKMKCCVVLLEIFV